MKANTKYTALEILTEAGIEKPETKIGKMRVRIGGLSGIVRPDHVIAIPTGTKKVDVIVGVETATIPVSEDSEEAAVSEGARLALDAQGKVATANAEKIAEAKKVPQE